jgi:pilus assembly protein Flp/PilA
MNHLEFARAWLHVHLRSDRGASLVEYALLVALIALACFAAVEGLGNATSDGYSEIGSSFHSM